MFFLAIILPIGFAVAVGVILFLGATSIPIRKILIRREALEKFESLKKMPVEIISDLNKLKENKPADSFNYFNPEEPDFLWILPQNSALSPK